MYAVSATLRKAINAGNPQRVLLEFIRRPDGRSYNPVVTLSNEHLNNGFELMEYFNSETDLTIGLCPSAEFKFSLFNETFDFEDFDFGTFRAWLGARIDEGTPSSTAKTKTFTGGEFPGLFEFTPLGTFIAEKPNIVRKKIVTVNANDQMILFDQDMPDAAALGITYPVTIEALAQALCRFVGVTMQGGSFLNRTLTVSAQPEEFEDATMREVLGWIAEAAGSIARFNRDGKLEFAWFAGTDKEYDEHNYSEFNPAWYETKPIDKLTIRNGNADGTFVSGTGSNAYVIQGNPFLKQGESSGGGDAQIVINKQPVSRKGKANTLVSFSVLATNAIEYQWQRRKSGGNWTTVPENQYEGAKTGTLRTTVTKARAGYEYRCVLTNNAGSVYTNAVTLTVVS